jgi:tRNA (guanine-N7-)-methyltransferase
VRRAVRLPLESLKPYLVELEEGRGTKGEGREKDNEPQSSSPHSSRAAPHSPLDWPTLFGNDHPVEIEVGFGKGLFLLTAGTSRPDTNFLGIEIERKFALYVANRVAKRKLGNVRVACGDARLVFDHLVPEASVQAVHVYFPDPWWKTRHRKRRLFTSAFAAACVRVLRSGGNLHVATDVADYFTEMMRLLAQHEALRPLPVPPLAQPQHDLDYLTNFERKYRHEGRAISRALFAKI